MLTFIFLIVCTYDPEAALNWETVDGTPLSATLVFKSVSVSKFG